MTAGDSPNDLLDRRDLLLDKLAEYGQISVEQIGTTGAVKVSFVDAATPATTYSVVDGRPRPGPAPPRATPGRPAAASARCWTSPSPAARWTSTRARSTRSPAR
jgi:hypothetical protein